MPVFTSSIEVTADYPTIKPSLNLNFARARALDPRITFTRASVGTYVGRDGLIKTAGNNEARFDHDPVTLESLGLLIEESRTNSLTYSQPTSAASFGSNGTFTYNAATAPNGATEAFRITHNGSSGNSNWRATRGITFGANSMVLSIWAKGGGGNNYFVWSFQNLGGAIVRAGFKLEGDGETSIITNGNGGHTLQIEKYPDGWYRCIIIGNTQSSGGTTQFLYTASAYSESSSISGGSVLLWGFQLEEGSFPTSYIPTSGSSVTRQADFGSITGESFSNFFNQSEGTFDVGYRLGEDNTSMRVAQVSNGGTSNVIDLIVASGGGTGGYWFINTGGVSQFSAAGVTNSSQVDRNFRAVLAYKENDCAAQQNKITAGPTTDTSVTLATDYDRLLFYQVANNGDHIQGHLKFIRYYPKRLTDAQVTLFSQD
jgi:hypothetical protein